MFLKNPFSIQNNSCVSIYSPVSGEMLPLELSPDPMFAQKMMGEGFAFHSRDGLVVAPAKARVASVFPTKHAVGLITEQGVELLIHVGVNTVELNGRYFESFAQKRQEVIPGTPLLKFDGAAIRAAGYDDTVMLTVTNAEDFTEVALENKKSPWSATK